MVVKNIKVSREDGGDFFKAKKFAGACDVCIFSIGKKQYFSVE